MRSSNENYSPVTLQVLGIFRLILAAFLSSVYLINNNQWITPRGDFDYFKAFLLIYLAFVLFTTLLLKFRFLQKKITIFISAVIDLSFIGILCFLTDGLNSPIIIMLLISTMAHGAFLSLAGTIFLIIYSLCIQLCLWYLFVYLPSPSIPTLQNLLINKGLIRFIGQNSFAIIAVIFSNIWLRKYETSQKLVADQNKKLQEASLLHEAIIQQSKSGLIAINEDGRIILMNNYIKSWFGDVDPTNNLLMEYIPSLTERFYLWYYLNFTDDTPFVFQDKQYYIEFNAVKNINLNYSLILIEPTDAINVRAQQNKLAALGRLTAAIAHEIRNPMTSIYQASQLLGEQKDLTEMERKLINMINTNVSRSNRIINDILMLAKKPEDTREYFQLDEFIEQTAQEFELENPRYSECICLVLYDEGARVHFDRHALRQIVMNLINNATLHSKLSPETLLITIQTKLIAESPCLTIFDNGVGISEENQQRIFEPFYTTHTQGTGLGLFISNEICLANNAKIQYVTDENYGSGFRIIFSKIVQ